MVGKCYIRLVLCRSVEDIKDLYQLFTPGSYDNILIHIFHTRHKEQYVGLCLLLSSLCHNKCEIIYIYIFISYIWALITSRLYMGQSTVWLMWKSCRCYDVIIWEGCNIWTNWLVRKYHTLCDDDVLCWGACHTYIIVYISLESGEGDGWDDVELQLKLTMYNLTHHSDVIMGTMASPITSLTIVYSTGYSGADQRKH